MKKQSRKPKTKRIPLDQRPAIPTSCPCWKCTSEFNSANRVKVDSSFKFEIA